MKLTKIISGGQTGVDRAALDAAIFCDFSYGGSIPKGRRAEDGVIDLKYKLLQELDTPDYMTRTEKNVLDSDATLIINKGILEGGTAQTFEFTLKYGKPCLVINIDLEEKPVEKIYDWIKQVKPCILNIAGPRESKCPGIYRESYDIIVELLEKIKREK